MGNQCSSCSLTEDELNEVKVEPKFQAETNGAAEGGKHGMDAAKAKSTVAANATKKGAAMPSTPLSAKQRDQAADANANASSAVAQSPAKCSAAASSSPSQQAEPKLCRAATSENEHPSAKATPRDQEEEGPGPKVPPPASAVEPGPKPPLSAARMAASGPKAPLLANDEDPLDTAMEPTSSATSKPAVALPRLSLPVPQASKGEPEPSSTASVTFSPSGQAALGDEQPLLPFGDYYKAHFDANEMVATVPAPPMPLAPEEVAGAVDAVDETEEDTKDPAAKIVDSVPKNLDAIFACETLPAADVCEEASLNDTCAVDASCVETALKVADDACEEASCNDTCVQDASCVETALKVADSPCAELSEPTLACPTKAAASDTAAWWARPSVGTWLMSRTTLAQPEERHEGNEEVAVSKILDTADIEPASSCPVTLEAVDDFDPTLEASAPAATEKELVDSAAVAPEAAVTEAHDLLTKAADDESPEGMPGMPEASAEDVLEAAEVKIVSDLLDLAADKSSLPVVGDEFAPKTEDCYGLNGSVTGLEDLAIAESSEEFGVVKDAHAGM